MNRDGREPFVAYCSSGGYRDTSFPVCPMSLARIGQGHYVLIPVLSEHEGDDLIKRFKCEVALKVQSDPELFVFGSGEATEIVQDALVSATHQPGEKP